MTGVPVGAKAAWCMALIQKAGAQPLLCVEAATGYTLSDVSSGTEYSKYHCVFPSGLGGVAIEIIKIHLDSNGQFKWCTSVTNSTVSIGSAIDYEM
jgi:hypothetical protein